MSGIFWRAPKWKRSETYIYAPKNSKKYFETQVFLCMNMKKFGGVNPLTTVTIPLNKDPLPCENNHFPHPCKWIILLVICHFHAKKNLCGNLLLSSFTLIKNVKYWNINKNTSFKIIHLSNWVMKKSCFWLFVLNVFHKGK